MFKNRKLILIFCIDNNTIYNMSNDQNNSQSLFSILVLAICSTKAYNTLHIEPNPSISAIEQDNVLRAEQIKNNKILVE